MRIKYVLSRHGMVDFRSVQMLNSDVISAYIEKIWIRCANAKTVEMTEEYGDLIDIILEVSNYEQSLISTLSVD